MADYCTLSEAKALLVESGLGTTEEYNPAISVLITAASRTIDRAVGRQDNYFSPSSDDGTYYYDGNDTSHLQIDDFASITSVSVSEEGGLASSDYTLWSSSDYITVPYNTTPIYALVVDVLNGSKLYFYRYRKAVKVVGVRGYSATPPPAVNLACRAQVSIWLAETKQMFLMQGASAEFGNIATRAIELSTVSGLSPKIQGMLHTYIVRAQGDE